MEMKIEKWQVENGIAKPVNMCETATERDYYRRKSDGVSWGDFLNKEWNEFYKFAQQHTYATSAPNGIHSAEMFGEVEEQIYRDDIGGIWQTLLKYEITLGYEIRSFLPFKHPVEPNDKQQVEILAESLCVNCGGSVDVVRFGEQIVDITKQALNPNANAISVIEKRVKELSIKRNESTWQELREELLFRIKENEFLLKKISNGSNS